ncbi:hypothetical protein GT360_08145 [Vibrio astriarenae]|uniref:Phosphoribosyl-AMP cyclohydrolase n=1 Tax=Vibrio astriarenae TaxID=1481923 RepID=A0A7Z2T330_9VIBR|nr:hypothetical protein [Vibrio astriarenae]QIA63489.1 hypothetical protein GT360_08145 [Vibrio astriarenae]
MTIRTLLSSAVLLSVSLVAVAEVAAVNQSINEAEVLAAQENWCNALVNISRTHQEQGQEAAHDLAKEVIDSAYAYQMGAVLFKPTLTVNPQTFRTDSEGALSYFVGGNANYVQDTGFALKDWTECSVENAGVLITSDSASTMGKVHFTNSEGEVTSVDKTWKFVKDDEGTVRIALHHSSLEFTGE